MILPLVRIQRAVTECTIAKRLCHGSGTASVPTPRPNLSLPVRPAALMAGARWTLHSVCFSPPLAPRRRRWWIC